MADRTIYDAEASLIEALARELGGGSSDDYDYARKITTRISALIRAHLGRARTEPAVKSKHPLGKELEAILATPAPPASNEYLPTPGEHCKHQSEPRNGWCLQCVHRYLAATGPAPHGVVYDKPGWLCSVCGFWNNIRDNHCAGIHLQGHDPRPPCLECGQAYTAHAKGTLWCGGMWMTTYRAP